MLNVAYLILYGALVPLHALKYLLPRWKDANGMERAEVIKVEHPTRGDDTRAWGPPYANYTAESTIEGPGESAYFLAVSLARLGRG